MRRGDEPADETRIYTWADASLRELTECVQEAQPAAKRSTARIEFALVYPDKRGRNVMRQACKDCPLAFLSTTIAFKVSWAASAGLCALQSIELWHAEAVLCMKDDAQKLDDCSAVQVGGTHAHRVGPDDAKTLRELNFQVFIALAALQMQTPTARLASERTLHAHL